MLSRSLSIAVLRLSGAVAIVDFVLCFVFGITVYSTPPIPRHKSHGGIGIDQTHYHGNTLHGNGKPLILFKHLLARSFVRLRARIPMLS